MLEGRGSAGVSTMKVSGSLTGECLRLVQIGPLLIYMAVGMWGACYQIGDKQDCTSTAISYDLSKPACKSSSESSV